MKLQKIQPQHAFILNVCKPTWDAKLLAIPIFIQRSPFPCMGTFSPVTVRIGWLTGWIRVCFCSDRTSGQIMEMLLPVSMVRCSSTLPTTNGFSAPCTKLFSNFQLGSSFALVVSLILLSCSSSNRLTASAIEKISWSFIGRPSLSLWLNLLHICILFTHCSNSSRTSVLTPEGLVLLCSLHCV